MSDAAAPVDAVRAALESSREVDALAVSVELDADGAVLLTGTVRTHAERLAAAQAAADAAPETRVVSRITVELSVEDPDDAELGSRVARALAGIGDAATGVGFDVRHGVVVLGGRVAAADRAHVRHVVEEASRADGVHDPMRTDAGADEADRGMRELDADGCWDRLAGGGVGRLATRDGDDLDITPVDVLARHRMLYFRTAPGAKLERLVRHPRVAVELDGVDDGVRWSVVVRGLAERLDSDPEIEESGVLGLRTAHPSPKHNYVRVRPEAVSGREFPV